MPAYIAYLALLDTLAAEVKTINDKIDGYTEAQRYFIGLCPGVVPEPDRAVGPAVRAD